GAEAPARGVGALVAVWRGAAGEERWRRELEAVDVWQDFWLSREGDAEVGTLELRAELPASEGACFSRPLPAAPPPPRPANVVLVSIDTLRADALADAPALGLRAAAGRSFTAAYALSNWTLPSHAGLLLSRSYLDHGLPLSGETAAFAYPEGRLSPGWTTLAEAFRDAGYATLASTEGGYLDPKFGFARGFDDYGVVPALTVDRASRFETHVERLSSFVREGRGGRPFFVFLHTYRVHDYLLNTPEYQCELTDADPELRALGDLNPRWAAAGAGGARAFAALPLDYARSLYRCGVAATDRRIEEAVSAIEAALGPRERLLIAFTSDHGESFGERERVIGHGTSLHEEQIHVPLILWANDGSVAAERVAAPVSALDLAPTLLAWADVPAPASLRGRASLLEGGARPSAVEAMASGLAGDFHERYLAWARVGAEARFERRDRADGTTDRRRCERFGAGSSVPVPLATCAVAESALASELEGGGEWTWAVRALGPGDLLLRIDLGRSPVAAVVASSGSAEPLLDAASGVVRFSARRKGETLLIFARGDGLALEGAEWDGAPLELSAWPTEPGAGATLKGMEGSVLHVARRSPGRFAEGAAPSPEEVDRLERELRALGYLQ
ncbi:MAG: sulfatase, partial [Acidobacteria bacterium]|nr:sulfatase [Acidobacteriota bacterium]